LTGIIPLRPFRWKPFRGHNNTAAIRIAGSAVPVLREFSARRKGNPQILADFRVPATRGGSQSASDVYAALNLSVMSPGTPKKELRKWCAGGIVSVQWVK
jgi:hypothetical protein